MHRAGNGVLEQVMGRGRGRTDSNPKQKVPNWKGTQRAAGISTALGRTDGSALASWNSHVESAKVPRLPSNRRHEQKSANEPPWVWKWLSLHAPPWVVS